jgi:hypothetical protein
MTGLEPARARSNADYMVLLRRRREVAGLSYRQLERRARDNGSTLPPSTTATMLHRANLPAPDLITTYVRACGGDDVEVTAWLATRASLAAGAIAPAAPRADGESALPVRPRQLPVGPSGMFGRERLLPDLDAVTCGSEPGLVVVTGMPGVGKTALTVHWARRAGNRFADGQLYVDLGGQGSGTPLSTVAALTRLLVGLGVAADAVPADDHQAAALFRSVVADRQLLLVLDGVSSADQVRLLQPGGPGSCTVVTSRDTLVELAVHEGAARIVVPPLDRGDAIRVLARAVGERLVSAELSATRRLTDRCHGLPLALRIAAEVLDRTARTPIADLVARIDDAGALAELAVRGDPAVSVEASFRTSYEALDEPSRRSFRALGTLPMPVRAAGVDAAALRRLVDRNLVTRVDGDRYAMHALLHEYARRESEHPVPLSGSVGATVAA